jgi:hypothetical protein
VQATLQNFAQSLHHEFMLFYEGHSHKAIGRHNGLQVLAVAHRVKNLDARARQRFCNQSVDFLWVNHSDQVY